MGDHDSFRLLSRESAFRFLVVAALVIVVAHVTGCADSEFEIAQHKAMVGERLRLNVIPFHGELVVLQWNELPDGKFCLHARRIQPNRNYTKSTEKPDVRRIGCQEDFQI